MNRTNATMLTTIVQCYVLRLFVSPLFCVLLGVRYLSNVLANNSQHFSYSMIAESYSATMLDSFVHLFKYNLVHSLLVSTKNTDWPLPNHAQSVMKVHFSNRWQPPLFQISERAKTSRKSVVCGLPALELARVRVLGPDQKETGTRLLLTSLGPCTRIAYIRSS